VFGQKPISLATVFFALSYPFRYGYNAISYRLHHIKKVFVVQARVTESVLLPEHLLFVLAGVCCSSGIGITLPVPASFPNPAY
jgi:hypothetical protein